MEQIQTRIEYYPKKERDFEWQTTASDITQFVNFKTKISIKKTEDATELQLYIKDYFSGNGTYDSATKSFTITSGPNLVSHKWRWFTLVDSNNNRFKISDNSSNIIQLSSDYSFVASPVSGAIKITLPDFIMDDELDFLVWNVTDGDYTEPTDLTDKLLFIGQVVGVSNRYTDKASMVTLKVGNITELLFKNIKSYYYQGASGLNKWYEIVKNLVDGISARNKGLLPIVWDPNNPTVKSDGSDFPDITYSKQSASTIDAIWELCQDKYTEDGEYYFYIKPYQDSANRQKYLFSVRRKNFTAISNLIEGTDFRLNSRKIQKGDLYTYIILKCGKDPDNKNITTYRSGNLRNGFRSKLVSEDFTSPILKEEIQNNPSRFDVNSENGKIPTSFSTDYVTHISVTAEEVANSLGNLPSTGTYTLTSAKEFIEWVRHLAIARGQIYANMLLTKGARIQNTVSVTYYNQPLSSIPGDVHLLKIPSIGWTGGDVGQYDYRKKLRMQTMNVSVSDRGIATTVDYKEDWQVVA